MKETYRSNKEPTIIIVILLIIIALLSDYIVGSYSLFNKEIKIQKANIKDVTKTNNEMPKKEEKSTYENSFGEYDNTEKLYTLENGEKNN